MRTAKQDLLHCFTGKSFKVGFCCWRSALRGNGVPKGHDGSGSDRNRAVLQYLGAYLLTAPRDLTFGSLQSISKMCSILSVSGLT